MDGNGRTASPVTLAQVRAEIGAAVGDLAALDTSGGDLIGCGLDSLKVMTLASRWRAAGVQVRYAELMARPTLDGWWALLSDRQADTVPAPAAPEIADDTPFDLATMQHAYWVGRDELLVLGGVATHFYAEFDGARIDVDRLTGAVRALLRRHGMLRARITEDGRQRIMPASPWPGPTVHDLRASGDDRVAAALAVVRDRLSHRRFDVTNGEVFDVAVSLLPDGTSRMHLNIDMLVADALSFRIILNDLAALYADPAAELPPIGYSFPRYLADRRARPAPGRAVAEKYWRERVPVMPSAPRLPLAVEPDRLPEHRVTRRFHRLDHDVVQLLTARSHATGITPSMLFATAFAEVIGRWSGDSEFLLNVPMFDREPIHPDVDHLVGDFTNLLIVAARADGGPFARSARRMQERVRTDAAHAEHSGLDVLRDLAREHGGPVLAPVVFTSALGLGELFTPRVRSCFGNAGWNISQAPQVWLDHQVTEDDNGWLLNWDAVDGLFADGVLDDMFGAYLRILAWLAEPDADWSAVPPDLLPRQHRDRRTRINATDGPQRETLLHGGFARWAAQRPDDVALVTAGRTYSYRDVADRAGRIAARLVACGLRAGDVVAVTLPKGPGQIEAVLGVLWAGGAFAPIGVDVPPARRRAIHAVAGVRFMITDAGRVADTPGLTVLDVDQLTASPLPEPRPVDPDDLAYVIYTSGSTGEPKGVAMTHRAAMNTVEDIGDRFGIDSASRGFALSALDHDWSVYDIVAFLSVGGSLVLIGDTEQRDAHRWLELVRAHQVTVWTSVPALLDMLLVAAGTDDAPLPLRLALVGGDWVGLDLYQRLTERAPGCRLVALGGATEVGIHSTWHEVTEVPAHWRSVPYGDPLRNQRTRVVDHAGHDSAGSARSAFADCPDWVTGELWLGGVGVGPGYLADPELTAARFVEHDGTRWYRTGDLARYRPDGTLEFLGRTDSQVKILGHRIDLGDLAAALRRHPGVTHAVALTTADRPPRLVAAVTPSSLEPAALTAFLTQELPDYLIPQQILALDALPLTANGKIDRRSLVERMSGGGERRAEPVGDSERVVAELWADLLDSDGVGRSDNFFALGGNSLLATRLITALRNAGFAAARLSDLFREPTLRGFAATVGTSTAEPATRSAVTCDPARRYEPFGATDVQRAYWLGRRPEFTLGGVGSTWYWEFAGRDVDVDRLRSAWQRVVDRHDMLRVVFDDDARQRVLPDVPPFHVPVVDAGADPTPAIAAMRAELSHRVFAPDRWPMFDLRMVRAADGTVRIGVCLDFLTLDALSIMLVFADLTEWYADPDATLPPLALTFRDCVEAGGPAGPDVDKARDYWQSRVADLPPGPRLPLAVDPGRIDRPRFSRREHRLEPARWQRLTASAARIGVTPSTVVAAAFAAVLRQWSADPAFTLNFTLFDRSDIHPDIYRVVGDFTSLLLVTDRPVAGESFADAVRRLQGQIWTDMEHCAYSGLSVLRDLARHTGSAELPMPVVFTSTLGVASATDRPFSLHTPFGDYVTGLSQTPQVWLDHQVTEHDGGLLLNWDAVDELFAPGVLDTMFVAYQRLLDGITEADADWSTPPVTALPADQAAVRRRVNDTDAPYTPRPLHAGFLATVARTPERTALAWGDCHTMTYADLDDAARRIAAALVAAGVRPGDRVAIGIPRCRHQIAAVLGVLFAGAAYVPIGIDQPPLRRTRICGSAGIRVALTEVDMPDGVPRLPVADALRAEPLADPVPVGPDATAYVIYTSGSTGEPKGVELTHAAAWNTVEDINDRLGVTEDDRVLAVSSVDFDLSVYDIFGLLAAGGAVVLIADDERADALAWRRLLAAHRVTVWNSAPALLDMLTAAADAPLPDSLRVAMVSGDWVGMDLPGRLARRTGGRCRLIALGGATEAAIWSNAFEVTDVPAHWTSIPYGFPLRNQRFRVVDMCTTADRPDWVPGELWIGGRGVAVGYHGDPERTAARFVAHDGLRWYRTGDLGRYWPDGTLEFLGRADQQVKVRGHRIELGEVEAGLESCPGVARAVVVAPGERARRLVAAVVGHGIDGTALRMHLLGRLPEYMVPGRIEVLDELPLTANGKVDRRAVQALLAAAEPMASEPPRGRWETAVAALWAELLGHPSVGRDLGFFAMGGDSLLATRLVEHVGRRFGIEFSLRDVMTAPTVAGQAELIGRRSGVDPDSYEEGTV